MIAFSFWVALLLQPATPHAPAPTTSGYVGTAIPRTLTSVGQRPARPRGLARSSVPDLYGNPFVVRLQPSQIRVVEPSIGQQFEMVYLTPGQPQRFRVTLQLYAKTLASTWLRGLQNMFNSFDRDGDGLLNGHELQYILPAGGMVQLMTTGVYYPQGDDPPTMPEIDRDHDTRVSFAEYTTFFASVANNNIQVAPFVRDTAFDEVSLFLYQSLDIDENGKLSADELEHAAELTAAFDSNHDDCISRAELQDRLKASSKTTTLPGDDGPSTGGIVWKAGQLDAEDRETIFSHYKNDSRLSLSEFNSRFDNSNVIDVNLLWVDRDELCKVTVSGSDDARRVDARRMLVLLSDATLDAVSRGRIFRNRVERTSVPYANAFPENVDALNEDEIGASTQSQILYVIAYLADHNDDGNLSRSEFQRFIDMQKELTMASLQFQLVERRLNIFTILDRDNDARLSPRELRNAGVRLLDYQPGHEATLHAATLHRPILTLRLEPLDANANTAGATRVRLPGTPIWFEKMDRNNDGDISPSEFLGTLKQYQQLDGDGDGLIDVDEAMNLRQH